MLPRIWCGFDVNQLQNTVAENLVVRWSQLLELLDDLAHLVDSIDTFVWACRMCWNAEGFYHDFGTSALSDLHVQLGSFADDDVIRFDIGADLSCGNTIKAFLSQLVGSPGNAASVVSVGSGIEGDGADSLLGFGRDQHRIGHLCNIFSAHLCDIFCNRIGTAQHLEGIETKAVGFILDADLCKSQLLGHLFQISQRSFLILRDAFVKSSCLVYLCKRHDRQIFIACFGHLIDCPLDCCAHSKCSVLLSVKYAICDM